MVKLVCKSDACAVPEKKPPYELVVAQSGDRIEGTVHDPLTGKPVNNGHVFTISSTGIILWRAVCSNPATSDRTRLPFTLGPDGAIKQVKY